MELQAGRPARPRALDAPTLSHAFQLTAAERPDDVALRTPGDGVAITWREYAERVEAIAGGLAALGVERGDTVGIMLRQPPRVPPRRHGRAAPRRGAVLGLQHEHRRAGRPPVPQRRQPRRDHRGALPARPCWPPAAHAPELAHVVQVDGADDDIISLAELEGTGASALPLRRDLAGGRAGRPRRDHLHVGHDRPAEGRRAHARERDGRVRARGRSATRSRPAGARSPTCPPPTSSTAGRATGGASLTHGFSLTSVADLRTVIFLLPGVRPTSWGGGAADLGEAAPGAGSRPAALGEEERAGCARLGLDAAEHLGGGAAPMPIDVLRSFEALGLPIAEAWGMSETAGASTANPPDAIRAGTCGTRAGRASRSTSRPTASCWSAARP